MKMDSLTKNVLRVMENHTRSLHKKFDKKLGDNVAIWMQASMILSLLGNMFGITQGGVIKALTELVNEGKVIRQNRGNTVVYSIMEE